MFLECYLDKMFEIKHEAVSYFSQCFQKPIVDSPFQDEVNFCFLFLEDNFSFYTPFFLYDINLEVSLRVIEIRA